MNNPDPKVLRDAAKMLRRAASRVDRAAGLLARGLGYDAVTAAAADHARTLLNEASHEITAAQTRGVSYEARALAEGAFDAR